MSKRAALIVSLVGFSGAASAGEVASASKAASAVEAASPGKAVPAAEGVSSGKARTSFQPHHEFLGSISYAQSTGSTSTGDTKSTDATQSGLQASLGYGYIFSNWTEALVEVKFSSEENKLAEFTDGRVGTEFGLGILFNVPIGDWEKEGGTGSARWLPFGGIILSQATQTRDKKTEAESNYDNSGMVTKLVLGNRYFLFPNVALHSSLRASYQTDTVTEKSESGVEMKASSNKLMLELDLLSLAVLF